MPSSRSLRGVAPLSSSLALVTTWVWCTLCVSFMETSRAWGQPPEAPPTAAHDNVNANDNPGAASIDDPSSERQRRRRQWTELTPQQRREIRALYARLEQLPPEKRQQLLQRLRELSQNRRQRILEQKPKARIDRQRQKDRQRERRVRFRALRRWIQSLPQDERHQLENLPPHQYRGAIQRRAQQARTHLLRRYVRESTPQERRAFRSADRPQQDRLLRRFLQQQQRPKLPELFRGLTRGQIRLLESWSSDSNAPRRIQRALGRTLTQRWGRLSEAKRQQLLEQARAHFAPVAMPHGRPERATDDLDSPRRPRRAPESRLERSPRNRGGRQ